jgi:hypothetical protein
MGHEEAVLHGRRLGMTRENDPVSAQDLIEEARKARELNER